VGPENLKIPYFHTNSGQEDMKNTYLHRVYRHNRKLFIFILFFSGATLFCNFTGFEITPFFVWGMYSQPEKPAVQYDLLLTSTTGRTFLDVSSGYSDDTRFFLNAPLAWYRAIRDNSDEDPTFTFLQKKFHERPIAASVFHLLPDKRFNSSAQLTAFPHWYRNYLEEVMHQPVNKLFVAVVRVHYDHDCHVIADSTFLTDTWINP
jgi:hypothetical protein